MNRKKVNGSISVFLAVTITLIMSFCLVLIESARENTLLLKADVVMNAGVQSVMAEFSVPLWEKYDLLYVDSRYGEKSTDYTLVKNHFRKYIDKNLELGNQGWLGLEYKGVQISDVLLATDFYGKDFYLQAALSAKESAGVSYLEQIKSWFDKVESTYNMGDFLDGKVIEVEESIEEVNGTEIEVEEDKFETVYIDNPLDQMLSGNILLRQVISDYSSISNYDITMQELSSHRKLEVGTMLDTREDNSIINKIFFCQYAMDHFEHYRSQNQDGKRMLHCELEYLIGGKSCDAKNLEIVTAELLLLREIDNYLFLLQDELKMLEAHELAVAATATLVPWLEPVVYQAILIYWAYEESISDLQALFRGDSIPLTKSLNLTDGNCLGYEDYLILLLLLQSRENLAMRSIDIIEMSLREEDEGFQMDACIGQAVLNGAFYDNYDKRYSVSGKIQYY